jgi:hypothetical protein
VPSGEHRLRPIRRPASTRATLNVS